MKTESNQIINIILKNNIMKKEMKTETYIYLLFPFSINKVKNIGQQQTVFFISWFNRFDWTANII